MSLLDTVAVAPMEHVWESLQTASVTPSVLSFSDVAPISMIYAQVRKELAHY